MRAATLFVCLFALLGCGVPDAERPSPPEPATPAEAPTEDVAEGPAQSPEAAARGAGAVEAPPSTPRPEWGWRGGEPSFREFTLGGPAAGPDGVRCELRAPREHQIELRCSEGGALSWSRTHTDFVGAEGIARADDLLLAVEYSHIATGAVLIAYWIGDGTERWRRPLVGMGPDIAHSEYLNAVQLEVVDGQARVFGWESAGKYIEARELTSGRLVGNWQDAGGGWAASAEADRPSPRERPSAPPAAGVAGERTFDFRGGSLNRVSADRRISVPRPGGGTCRFEGGSERSVLECVDGEGARTFAWERRRQGFEGASLAIDQHNVYVAHFSPIATGCEVVAYDHRSGEVRWRTPLFGVSLVAHSRYRNEVELRLEDGALRAFGWELAGRYLEILDPASGERTGYRRYE